MPFIAVHIAKGRPLEKRRRLAAAITDIVTDILELERSATQVLIQEHDGDNWAIGGELMSDRRSSAASLLPDLDALFRKPAAKSSPKPAAKVSRQKSPAKSRSRR
jgi:4-oxalocrotonate tautomerase